MEKSKNSMLNVRHNLTIEVLTPLHIGAGVEKDWIKGSDFIDDGNKVKVLNINKVAQVVGVHDLTNALLKKDGEFLKDKMGGHLDQCVQKEFNVKYLGNNDIKTFTKNGLNNKPIVPGSSVKGALRSIVLESLFSKQEINRAINNGKLNERSLFGQADHGDELFRFVKISDACFQETTLSNTKVFNLSSTEDGGWKHGNHTSKSYKPEGFNTFYEIIPGSSKSIMSLSIAEIAFKNYGEKIARFSNEKERFIKSSIHDLFKIINQHTKNYLEKEKAFFEKYDQAENSDKILDSIENLLSIINQANNSYCVLKMAAGSGFHSITGDWQYDDYSIDSIDGGDRNRGKLNGKKSAKSRKIAIHNGKFELMGFVKLSLASDEEVSKNEELLRKSINELNSILIAKESEKVSLAAKLKAEQVEKERKQEEENLRIAEELARIEAEKQAKIEAERQAEAERIEKERLERENIEALLRRKEEDLVKSQEANILRKESELAEVLSKGLVDLSDLNDFENGKKIIEGFFKANNSSLITESPQIDLLKQFVAACIGKNNKRWKKAGKQDWVLVAKWVGKEMAQQWYNSLILK